MQFVTLLSKILLHFPFYCYLLAVTGDRIASFLKTSGARQAVVLDILKDTGFLWKFSIFGFMKKCFIFLIHFVVAKDYELF